MSSQNRPKRGGLLKAVTAVAVLAIAGGIGLAIARTSMTFGSQTVTLGDNSSARQCMKSNGRASGKVGRSGGGGSASGGYTFGKQVAKAGNNSDVDQNLGAGDDCSDPEGH